jgi:hypothetical protein
MWEEKSILTFIKTYPEYSSRYTETVCTGGIMADNKRLIRLYPIAYRYLSGEKQFKKYQWIKVKIKKSQKDSRPESFNIENESIELGSIIEPGKDWRERKKWVLSDSNFYDSLESLIYAEEEKQTSMGLIKPKDIINFVVKAKTKKQMEDATRKKKSIMNQSDMFREKSDLEILAVDFFLRFTCSDRSCTGHEISILDWEIAELYRKNKHRADWKTKLENKVLQDICAEERDTYLVMGNMVKRRSTFCILGFFWPPREDQLSIFD